MRTKPVVAVRLYVAEPDSVPVIDCAPASWMCEIALCEKGAPYERRGLSFAKGEHRSKSMLELNPNGTIPVLECPDMVIGETYLILEFIEMVLPGESLAAEKPWRTLPLLQDTAALKTAGMALFGFLMKSGDQKPDPVVLAAKRADFAREIETYDAAYASVPFLGGPRPSLADYAVFTYAAAARHLGLALAEHPHVHAFLERMDARPSVQATRPPSFATLRTLLA